MSLKLNYKNYKIQSPINIILKDLIKIKKIPKNKIILVNK